MRVRRPIQQFRLQQQAFLGGRPDVIYDVKGLQGLLRLARAQQQPCEMHLHGVAGAAVPDLAAYRLDGARDVIGRTSDMGKKLVAGGKRSVATDRQLGMPLGAIGIVRRVKQNCQAMMERCLKGVSLHQPSHGEDRRRQVPVQVGDFGGNHQFIDGEKDVAGGRRQRLTDLLDRAVGRYFFLGGFRRNLGQSVGLPKTLATSDPVDREARPPCRRRRIAHRGPS